MVLTRLSDEAENIKSGMKVMAYYMAIPLYLLFWVADWFYAGNYKFDFLVLRFSMIPISLFFYYLTTQSSDFYALQRIIFGFGLVNSFILNYMTFCTGGFESSYYAGLNLFALGVISFVPWTVKYLILVTCCTYIPHYLLSSILINSNQSTVSNAIVQTFFIIGTIVISFVIRFYNESLREKEFLARKKLIETIVERDEVIRKKTQEGIKLQELTKQFSPQVVHAIKNGELNLIDDIHRAEICCIFLDIVDSTTQIVNIDNKKTGKVISQFMEDTMKVLLKYDITIDKFLGDGVLAFSNDPLPIDDYVERVVQASLEITKRINSKQEIYKNYWQKSLQIRIGISTGLADIGFYGSKDYFKGYTAIGRVVNLASRLCSKAEPNQILIDLAAVSRLPKEKYLLKSVGSLTLKGFSGELPAFEVVESLENQISDIIPECPKGHGVLNLQNSAEGFYEFACRTCQFKLDDSHSNEAVLDRSTSSPEKSYTSIKKVS